MNNLSNRTVNTRPLLIELVTEELPPKALQRLGQCFAAEIVSQLQNAALMPDGTQHHYFATPRRLAVLVDAVRAQAPEQDFSERLMPVKVGLNDQGEATPALLKRLEAKGLAQLSVADLVRESDGKQDFLYARGKAPGDVLADRIEAVIQHSIDQLPIPKVMRYQLDDQVTTVRFVRPARRLVVLFGDEVLDAQILGLVSGRISRGHRFMGKAEIELSSADTYPQQLLEQGMVIASFEQRQSRIRELLEAQAQALGCVLSPRQAAMASAVQGSTAQGSALVDGIESEVQVSPQHENVVVAQDLGNDPEVEALLHEVTALVEHPSVYVGQFDPAFLAVPQECLILTMRLNQKYFPLFDPKTGKLDHRFLIVSNMQLDDPSNIIAGNERVVRPRLADAQFFFETDKQTPQEQRVAQLAHVVYHHQLGSQLARSQRVQQLAQRIASQLGLDAKTTDLAERAAYLAKADLSALMVGEFPELQGVMAAYYAQAEGETEVVCTALAHQYDVRFELAPSAEHLVALVLFVAERIETLVGMWSIGAVPTGERDPYGMRRAALGLISAMTWLQQFNTDTLKDLDLPALLAHALTLVQTDKEVKDAAKLNPNTPDEVYAFILERYRQQLQQQHSKGVIDAVLAMNPPLSQITQRLEAIKAFSQLEAADSLVAANKRISNLLKRADSENLSFNPALLREAAERALAQTLDTIAPEAQARFEAGDLAGSMATMASIRPAVDRFFDEVMVMTEDEAVRLNRLALLQQLHRTMNLIADIARLA